MIAQLKRLGGDSLLYALMNVGTKIIAFIMLPIYSRYLTPAEYGVLDYLDTVTALLTFVVIFGTDSALGFFYFDTKDEKKKLSFVRHVMLFRLTIIAILLLIVVIFGKQISILLFEQPDFMKIIVLAIIVLMLDTILAVILTVMRFDFLTVKVVVFTVLKMGLIAAISYLFLRLVTQTVDSVLYGRIVSGSILLFLLYKPFIKYLKVKLNKEVLIELLKYGAPLVPASISFWVIASSNRMFLNHFQSLEEVGIFGAAVKFASIITLLTSGVQMAWRPYSMSIKDKNGSERIFAKLYLGLLLVGIFGLLTVGTLMPYIILLLDPSYYEAYKYVAFLGCVTFLNFYYLIISVGLFFKKQTKVVSYHFGIAAVVNIALNFLLIPYFSIWGAVFSYLIAYIVAIILIFNRSQKVYYVPVSKIKLYFLFINLLIALISIVYIQETSISNWFISFAWIYMFIIIFVSRVDKDFMRKEASHFSTDS